MSRRVIVIALALGGCRTLLGIEDGVVGDGNKGDTMIDDGTSPDGACTRMGCSCAAHDACDSEVCLINRQCADSNVAYVAESGSGTTCTQTSPCATLNLAQATNRPVIKVTGSIRDMGTVTFSNGTFAIYGAAADVTNMGAGPVIAVGASTNLSIYNLDIHGASAGADPHGIFIDIGTATLLRLISCRIYDNQGAGLMTEGGNIIIDRSIFASNHIVGIQIDSGQYAITNSIIVKNGNTADVPGGVSLDPAAAPAPVSRFELNTVADNISMLVNARQAAIECPVDADVDNSIVAGGILAGGSCHPHYSMLDNPPGGGNNFTGAPHFLQTTDMNGVGYYRIGPNSDARDKAPPSTVNIDIDEDDRPSGLLIDVGADEYVP